MGNRDVRFDDVELHSCHHDDHHQRLTRSDRFYTITDLEEALTLRSRGVGAGLLLTSSSGSKNPFLLPTRVKASSNGSLSSRNSSLLLRPLSRLPFCHARPGLAAAADGLDRLFASALHGLRAYPWVRLAFLGYLLVLHVWAFGLLAFHSQRLEEVHADVGGSDPGVLGLPPIRGGD